MTDNYNNYARAAHTPVVDQVLSVSPLSAEEKAELKLRIAMLLNPELA